MLQYKMDGSSASPGSLSSPSKIIDASELTDVRIACPKAAIVLCHGTWDLIHPGVIDHLTQARAMGDILVVTVTADEFIRKQRPIAFSASARAQQIASIDIVDHVAIIHDTTALQAIRLLHPDAYVKGAAYRDLLSETGSNIHAEKIEVEQLGGMVRFTNDDEFSSTKLAHFTAASCEALQDGGFRSDPLMRFKDMSDMDYSMDDLHDLLRSLARLKVCVIGDCIIDEWRYVKLHSISQKSKCMTGEEIRTASQVGGAGVVALDLADFVSGVDLYTNATGVWPRNDKVNYICVNSGELVKTRFLNAEDDKILFESKRLGVNPQRTVGLLPKVDFDKYDAVVVADFGHGLVTRDVVELLGKRCDPAKLAVMAQANSSNFGFNNLTKFQNARYRCMNRIEASLCIQRNDLERDELIQRVEKLIGDCDYSITLGSDGCYTKIAGRGVFLPAVSNFTVDEIGCGDAFYAFSSIAALIGCDASISALAGSLAAAIMAQKLCNASPVSKEEFLSLAEIVI